VENFERTLEVKAGETTKDMKFTLETVNCLGPAPWRAGAGGPEELRQSDRRPDS